LLQIEHVQDSPRSGRPRTLNERTGRILLQLVRESSVTRQYSTKRIAHELRKQGIRISAATVCRYLAAHGLKKVKTTKKPGLNHKNRDARYRFCLAILHWTLEDWKNVIFSDETSVQLGTVRGNQRIWRSVSERHHAHCVRSRWKGRKEFMFWGCFRWAEVGPFLIWGEESAKAKHEAIVELANWNAEHEAEHRKAWEDAQKVKDDMHAATKGLQRLGLSQQSRRGPANIPARRPGRKAVWKHTEANGAKVRKAQRGGIDWYRYQNECLVPHFAPYAERCRKDNPRTIVQEDNAPAHRSKWNEDFWAQRLIRKIAWPGNSPDLNPIEQLWFIMKRQATANGPLTSRKQAVQAFQKAWEEVPAETLHRLVDRVRGHVKWVLVLHGDNKYKEGTVPPPEVWDAWLDERELEYKKGQYRVNAAEAVTDWSTVLDPPDSDDDSDWEDTV
jgi:transposase